MLIARDVRINREIRAKEVRVIDPEGKQLGILPASEALRLAINYELDLVEVSPKSEPPVCRIMDYGSLNTNRARRRMMQKETSCRPCQGSEDEAEDRGT